MDFENIIVRVENKVGWLARIIHPEQADVA